jgi:diguanylate cyclase (GGDEF)-like protein
VGAIIANVDITDRKEMENKLHREMIRALDYSVQLELSEQELKLQKKELEDKNQLLAKLAVTDGLTGLANHRNFRECLAEEFRNSKKNKTPLSLILLDIDCFKEYNDTYGHPAGDRVLQSLARVLTRNARESDLVARYGGEEFAVLLPHTSAEDSIAIAERLRKAVESTHWDFRSVTASFGVSTLEGQKITVNELIEQADKALYVSKNLGRNRVTHYGYRTQSVA